LTRLQVKWEGILKRDGLAPLDGHYTKRSKTVCYAIPQRIHFGAHSAAFAFEFFRMCEEYAREGSPRWPNIWRPYSQGTPWSVIAAKIGVSKALVAHRIKLMRAAMLEHFRQQSPEQPAAIPPGTEILEIFVEQSQRK
jgi:hypothetical protein